MITPDEAPNVDPEVTTARRPDKRPKKRKKRRSIKWTLIVTHRWLSLVLGLVLVLITTTGAIVLYTPEWQKWTNSDFYHKDSSSISVSPADAVDIVRDAHPDFDAAGVNLFGGVYEVSTADYLNKTVYGVDPSTGQITGTRQYNSGFMGLMNQIHECFFSCSGYPAYVPFLTKEIPTLGTSFLIGITWSSFILGVSGLLLLFLALSGLVLWWPGIKRWAHGFRVRMSKGRYARDYDLHQVIGLAAVPFLLMWALTGTSFEFEGVSKIWYSLTGGTAVPDDVYDFESVVPNGPEDAVNPDVSIDQIITGGLAAIPGSRLVAVFPPEPQDPTAYYGVELAEGHDEWAYGPYAGNRYVGVDRYDATHTKVMSAGGATLSNRIWDDWSSAYGHYGFGVNGWWRIIWFAFGLTPLVLMITGLSTWFFKRGVSKQKKRARAARAAATVDV